ncbi:MAG: tail fiber domain-containing protein [Burkholderiales bacterium]
MDRSLRTFAVAIAAVAGALLQGVAGAREVDGASTVEAGEGLARQVTSPLLAIDRNRATVVDRVVAQWGEELARSNAGITQAQLREMLLAMRADQLLAASLVGNLEGLRNVVAAALVSEADIKPSLAKALGDASQDVTYVPVTPCRLVETRGTFAAVYQGGGAFTPNQIRTYTLQGGNGVCLSQLPASATPSAVQMQVYGIPTTTGSGDIEILPQGSAFGSSASLVYLATNAFTSSAVTSPANIANKQISVQVRGGGAHVAIDVVGYFRPPQGGFVTSVTAGTGLTGGTITSSGTIGLAATQLLPTTACANNQIPKWNGSAWMCGTDANSGGTVTSVATGTGLTGGPITGAGTIGLAATQLLPTPACSSSQIPKWNGTAWACAADANSGGTVTSVTAGAGLTGGTITTAGTIAVDPNSSTLTGNFFRQGGNAFGATAVLGTIDNNAIDIRVNGGRVMRYEPDTISGNVVGGNAANSVTGGARGTTIAGGGRAASDCDDPILRTATRSCANIAGADYATVSGGVSNAAIDTYATVGGGRSNEASAFWATVAGGAVNLASAQAATVGGGDYNVATQGNATVAGGSHNTASGGSATVGGGYFNEATGNASTVPGGHGNYATGDYSLAAGFAARAQHAGSFIWSDSVNASFPSLTNNEVALRATGGMRVVLGLDFFNQPAWTCSVVSGGSWSCSSDRNQKQNLERLDGRAVLDKVAALPLYQWNPRGVNAHHRHYGPTAQDFYGAFGLGGSELSIGQQDADGVALAAIQGLNAKLEAAIVERDAHIDAQAREIADLRASHAAEIAELKRAVEVLLARTSPEGRVAAR